LRKTERVGYVVLVLACILALPAITIADHSKPASVDIQNGPHIDRVIYKYILGNTATKADAFLNDEIDLLLESMGLTEIATLDADPDIEIYTGFGEGYLVIDINCRDAPLNWTALRRAFAYAFDKTEVTAAIFGDLLTPQDSIVPLTSRFCIEEDLDWHYYSGRADIGNQLLDEVGFDIDPITGYRNDPNGNPMHILVGYPSYSPDIYGACAQAGVDAFTSLHISAETNQEDFNTYISGLYCSCSHDMLVYAVRFDRASLIGSGFWEEVTEDLQDVCYFSNSTYDMYLEDVLSSRSFYEVHDAAVEIQKLVHYNVPRLVICPTLIVQPFRTDRFTGLVEDCTLGVSGVWSLCNMHNITGNSGGSVRIGSSGFPASFNIYNYGSSYRPFLESLWPTLFSIGPNMELIPNIASSVVVERHADNPFVPEGYTRLTVDIIRNATWSDGVRLTAQDLVFTNVYEIESGAYGNPAAQDHEKLVTAYAPNPFRAVFEYIGESYWYFFKQAVKYIIPKHIFNNVSGIGYSGWDSWDPVFNPEDPHVTCGPFIVDSVTDTELEIKRNPNYHYNASALPESESDTTQTTDASFPYLADLQPLTPSPLQLISLGISVGSAIVIVNTVFHIIKHKRSETG